MKNKILFYSIAAIASALLAITSCQQDNDAAIMLDQEVVELGDGGGTGKVTYTLLNISEPQELTLEGMPEWITDPVTSVSGEITFTVAANTGEAREAVLTVACSAASAQFTVIQSAFKMYPSAEEMSGMVFYATWCQFYPDETYMFKYNNADHWVETDANGDFVYMMMGEWAQDFIDKYNADNPDSPETVDAVMGFDFTDMSSGTENYMYIKTSTESTMECWSGSRNEYGDVGVRSLFGTYSYDESTGIMTLVHEGNTTYTCSVSIQFKKLTDKTCEFQILGYEDFKWTDDGSSIDGHPYQPWLTQFGGDYFPFMLSDYDNSETFSWQPCGKMVYTCNMFANI